MSSDYMELTRNTYNKAAADWKNAHTDMEQWALEFGMFQWESRRIGRSHAKNRGKILDIGCGFGKDYHFFKQERYDYVGVDFSEGLLAEARALNPEGQFVLGDMKDLPFKDKSFDGFWAVASLLHIPKQDIRKVLRGIRAKMKNGAVGMIVIKEGEGEMVDPGDSWSKGGAPRFFAYYRKYEFWDILEKSGFEVVWAEKRAQDKRTCWIRFLVQRKGVLKYYLRKFREWQMYPG